MGGCKRIRGEIHTEPGDILASEIGCHLKIFEQEHFLFAQFLASSHDVSSKRFLKV